MFTPRIYMLTFSIPPPSTDEPYEDYYEGGCECVLVYLTFIHSNGIMQINSKNMFLSDCCYRLISTSNMSGIVYGFMIKHYV